MKITRTLLYILFASASYTHAQTIESAFLSPDDAARPLMIWQWMDGVVSREGITSDLEAYKEAGIGGVQQFQVGGPVQSVISDSINAIGTDSWKSLMRYALDECERLGLTFGTHNCPGWSSSASPQVTPEYSMQKLVWTDTTVAGGRQGATTIILPKPAAYEGFYKDIAMIATPDQDTINGGSAVVLTAQADGSVSWKVPKGNWRIYRIGHTSNGKTNYATAPGGGMGLECDKMSREALEKYWATYPSMILELAGDKAGKTFKRWEIDSYEAGGQEWTALLPEEFRRRRGYDIVPMLPFIIGVQHTDAATMKKLKADYQNTVTDLVAENYYGYMSEIIHRTPGMALLAQPYGTGASKPFSPINTMKIARTLSNDDMICAEFWTQPNNWGWKDVPRVVDAAMWTNHRTVFAEGFTCWPLHAWRDDPYDLKRVADRAFCLGLNALMLHAGAQNPWPDVEPGMTFGMWGTQWTPKQTWWKSGGAKMLFAYIAHCQSLLQRGIQIDNYLSRNGSLTSESGDIQWVHRRDGDTEIFFISNVADSTVSTQVNIGLSGRIPELWDARTLDMNEAPAWQSDSTQTAVAVKLNGGATSFIIMRKPSHDNGPGLESRQPVMVESIAHDGPWSITFPVDSNSKKKEMLDRLVSWDTLEDPDMKYFSGTASYSTIVRMKRVNKHARYILNLGEVENLAKVRVNGVEIAHLWCPPFECDVTEPLRKGNNTIDVEVTNLWVNRLVGDEQEPDDIEWDTPSRDKAIKNGVPLGQFMKEIPQWLVNGTPRPSQNRKTVVSYKFYHKDDPLLPSGLIGPVRLEQWNVVK